MYGIFRRLGLARSRRNRTAGDEESRPRTFSAGGILRTLIQKRRAIDVIVGDDGPTFRLHPAFIQDGSVLFRRHPHERFLLGREVMLFCSLPDPAARGRTMFLRSEADMDGQFFNYRGEPHLSCLAHREFEEWQRRRHTRYRLEPQADVQLDLWTCPRGEVPVPRTGPELTCGNGPGLAARVCNISASGIGLYISNTTCVGTMFEKDRLLLRLSVGTKVFILLAEPRYFSKRAGFVYVGLAFVRSYRLASGKLQEDAAPPFTALALAAKALGTE
ncbi:hypothetical protein dsx2_1620 [Desulfovibrio sp. X2]|uniref:hypothetical protein n=1 Tax=Desulfovibrio sp. X2 TaxID=941449 RepID=UPI000358B33F|nr:hypothetical protein [Desulfovibrio sp. X2]EPR44259.1 hypothetical protein dsx2_1620 [Desulfovibrio sp. X2]